MRLRSSNPPVRENEARLGQVGEAFEGRDFTTGYGPPEPRSASVLSTAVLVAGLWLGVSPYIMESGGPAAWWNSTAVGVAVIVVALVRMVTPVASAPLSAVNAALGGWLVAAPFVLGYEGGAGAAATWNAVVVGGLIVLFSLASWAVGSTGRARPPRKGARP